jgi:HEAT repeat protein
MMSCTTDQDQTPNPPADVQEILNEFAAGHIDSGRVTELSDPSRDQVRTFAVTWPNLPVETRREVVREMMRQSDEDLAVGFHRFFREAIGDPDDEVRALAIRALWEDENRSFLFELAELAMKEESTAVQEAIAVALGSFSYQVELEELDEDAAAQTQQALFHLLDNGKNWMVKRRALESAAFMSKNQRVKEAIQYFYESDFEQECAGALVAMSRNLDPDWFPLVRRELKNEDPDIRCEAARAAGEFGSATVIEDLARMIDDEDEEIREVSIRSIGRIGGRQSISTLRYLETQAGDELKPVIREAIEEAEFLAESTGQGEK